MSNSSLVSCTIWSPNCSIPRNHAIDRITPHCVVGQCTVEALGNLFANPGREASSNYGIGADGRVGLYVDEANRAWTSSSPYNDNRAVTIECASDTYHPYAMNEIVFERLVELCADICKRNGKNKLLWLGHDNYEPKSNEMLLTVHRWYASTICPGDWLMGRMAELANRVTEKLRGPQWVKSNGKWYLLDQNGNYITGWVCLKNKWYFMDPTSKAAVVGWHYDSGYAGWFFFGEDCSMQTGWIFTGNRWYYLAEETEGSNIKGRMVVGWIYWRENWYYCQEKKDSKHKEGELRLGWYFSNQYNCWFYLDPNKGGAMAVDWLKTQDNPPVWYYLYPKTANGHYKGEMAKGWTVVKGKTYYLCPKQTKNFREGQMVTGTVKIGKKTYEFDNSGALVREV